MRNSSWSSLARYCQQSLRNAASNWTKNNPALVFKSPLYAIAFLVWYFWIPKIKLSRVKREVVYMLTDEGKDNPYLHSVLTAVLLNKTQWCHYSFKAHRQNCIF